MVSLRHSTGIAITSSLAELRNGQVNPRYPTHIRDRQRRLENEEPCQMKILNINPGVNFVPVSTSNSLAVAFRSAVP